MNNKRMKRDDDELPPQTAAQLKQFRRVSPADVEQARLGMEQQYGVKITPRRAGPGRPPKGDLKYQHLNMRVEPVAFARVKAKAHKLGIKYQTFINQLFASV